MLDLLSRLAAFLRAATADRARLAAENVVLRQHLAVLKRSVKRARLDDPDRVSWIWVSRMFENWAEHLVIVKPETVIKWHRNGFACYWRRKALLSCTPTVMARCTNSVTASLSVETPVPRIVPAHPWGNTERYDTEFPKRKTATAVLRQ